MQPITKSRRAALMGILIFGAALAGCNDSTQSGTSGTSDSSASSSATADPAPASVTVLNPAASTGNNSGVSGTSSSGSGTAGTGSSSSGTSQTSSSGGSTSSSSGSSSSGGSSSSSSGSSSNTATLSWSAPTENTNGSALTNLAGYNIYYGTSLSAMVNKISINTVGIQTYVISDLPSGTWYFTVTAVNAAGVESTDSTTVQATL